MNTKVSYGALAPAMIGGLGVIVNALLAKGQRGEHPVVLKHLPQVIQFSDSGIWGDDSTDPNNDPRVFRVSDFEGDFRLDYASPPPRSIARDKLAKFKLQRGDILVVKSSGSANQVVSGRVAVFDPESETAYAASNFTLRLRASTLVDPDYLAFVLGSPPVREAVAESVKTMTYPNLSFKIYSTVTVPAIPLRDQRLVAAFFHALLNNEDLPPLPPYLAKQREIVARVQDLAAQIQEADSLRHQALNGVQAFAVSLHAQLSGQRTRKLGDILTLDEDAAPIFATDSYPQVGVKSFGAGLFPKAAVAGTATTYRTFNRLYDGALVLSQVKGWEGAVAVCPPELAGWFVSPEYRTFRCVPTEARPSYLAPLVRTEWFWSKLGNATRGVGARRERTRPEQFLQIELPMPDVEQQKRGEAIFAQLEAVTRLQTETILEMGALLPAILDRAFKGEL